MTLFPLRLGSANFLVSASGGLETLDWWYAIAATGTLLVSVLAVLYAVREHRSAREDFVKEMRMEWGKLRTSWERTLMAEHGSQFHYVDATPNEREKAAHLYSDLRTSIKDPTDVGYSSALELRADVRKVARFLSYAADSLLRGRWQISEAYEVFGPDLGRHHRTIRMLAFRRAGLPMWLEQGLEFNTFDEHDCLFLLSIFLRAEQCRRGDTYPHFAVELAKEMRSELHEPIRQSIHRVTRTRRRLALPRGLRVLLRRGRRPRVKAAYGVPTDPIIEDTEKFVFQFPLEPLWLLRLRISSAQKLRGFEDNWDNPVQ